MKKFYEHKVFAYIAIAIVVINLIMTFIVVVPSLAISDNNLDFSNQPVNVNDTITVYDGNNNYWTVTNNTTAQIYICAINYTSDQGIFYCFAQNIYQNEIQNVFVQIQDGRQYRFDSIIREVIYNNETWYISNTNVMYDNNTTQYITVPYYSNKDINFETVIQDIISTRDDGNNGGNESSTLNYSLPAGNLAIITTTASYETLKFTTTMPLQSTVFSSNPWPNTTQRIGTYNTLPQNLDASVLGSVIEWQKTGDKTLFGTTHSAIYQPTVISKFTYVVISNPYYYPANNMEDNQYTNGAINIVMDDVVSIEVRNLTALINTSTGEIENTQNGTSWTGEIDDETGDITWTDNNGDNTLPDSGGNLSDPTITGFQSWLKGILTSIRDIFEPAHDAIQTLSGSVKNFANWMYALYIWLPSPVLNLLTSAISLVIVIGVIKVFI